MAQATYPEVWRAEQACTRLAAQLPPYLVLLRVGFAVPRALLRGRCALTAPFHPYPGFLRPRRYVLCCAFRLTGLNPPSRTLSGTLLFGVRTFLSLLAKTATIRSVSRILFRFSLDERRPKARRREHERSGDGHSSRRRIAPRAQATYPETVARPNRQSPAQTRIGRAVLMTSPYLVLHHGEFA